MALGRHLMCAFVVGVLAAVELGAQTTGRITGRVVDEAVWRRVESLLTKPEVIAAERAFLVGG